MLKWINKKRNQKGFTLIELVVVIAILGILAAIAVPKLGGFKNNAKVAADKATAETIKKAAELYVAANKVENPSALNGDYNKWHGTLKDLLDTDAYKPQQEGKKFTLTYQENGEFDVKVESETK